MKNITLSADTNLIEKSRQRARRERTTLNAVFRQWLERYAGKRAVSLGYSDLMKDLSYAQAGRSFSREEMNER